jgi:hypothetical protein
LLRSFFASRFPRSLTPRGGRSRTRAAKGKNWDGPQPAIEKFELSGDKAVRATGKDDFVWEPFWLSANEFLCIVQKQNERQPSIYRMSLDGKNPKLLVKHARTPSATAP